MLVTGATGFVGRNVLRSLGRRKGVELVAACRTPAKLITEFGGEVRAGDLRDAGYRKSVVEDVDVICHTGTWGAFWGHEVQEREYFFEPAQDLIEQAIEAGARRFLLASTVAIGDTPRARGPAGDFSSTRHTGFWPHLDRLVDIDQVMREQSVRGTQMVTMRLGHFVGAGNELGLVGALASRLPTRLVPWIAGGQSRMPLVADADIGEAFALATLAEGLDAYESFNICGAEFPTAREVIDFIAAETGSPSPVYSVPFAAAHAFGWLMEQLHPVLPGKAPFLTRSLVHVARDWWCPTDYARRKVGYVPAKDWRIAAREALAELAPKGYPWPPLAQAI